MESYLKKVQDKSKASEETTLKEDSKGEENTSDTSKSSEQKSGKNVPISIITRNVEEENEDLKQKKAKKPHDLEEKEGIEKFKSYFQSPTLNRAFGDFMSMNLKTLREEEGIEESVSPSQIKPFVMGICGGTSAGKSQILKMIIKSLNSKKNTNKVTFLSEENFFKSQEEHTGQGKDIDYDHPDNVDWETFNLGLDTLLLRKKFEIPLYDMKNEDRKKETKLVEPTDLIIIEGRLIFYHDKLRNKCNLKIFLDTDEDVRLSRRIYKDVVIRKKKVEDVIDRYLKYVKPDFERYVFPSKKYADIIIPNYGGGFNNELPEQETDHDEIGFNQFDHAAVGLIIDQVYKKVKKIKEIRDQTANEKK